MIFGARILGSAASLPDCFGFIVSSNRIAANQDLHFSWTMALSSFLLTLRLARGKFFSMRWVFVRKNVLSFAAATRISAQEARQTFIHETRFN